ncbi:Transposase, Ptta/En/Spm, plant [Corchorus capsularis]|uniref:Transposase, Ptta/En/Spm, plant n=1 Tax=Corchorus capsularis TaxID=210143 RepID=A0A1R3JNR7_COCAP|nr:Transposase, Ptta/En/Spm, plant [Corchorus capsularis]
MENRRLMYNRNYPSRGGIRQEFLDGVVEFVEFTTRQPQYMSGDKIRCPCYKCENRLFLDSEDVSEHLCHRGFMGKYWNWTAHASDQPLWIGCDRVTRSRETQLSAVSRLLTIKSDSNISEATYNDMCDAIRNMLPVDNTLPQDFYHHKKLVRNLGLPVVKIDACPGGCMLYWKGDAELTDHCKFCGKSIYKEGRVFRLQPPPKQTTTSLPANVHPPPENNDEEEEQEEDEMDEEGVDCDELDHDLEAEEDAPDVQHDQQQQPVKLPPYPSPREPPMEPLPCTEDSEVPPLEISDNMLYGYDFHFWRILTGTIEGYYHSEKMTFFFYEQNKKNRNANGFSSTSGYRGGRVSAYTHRQRLTIEKKRNPTRVEIYKRTHGRKDGTYPSGQTAITMKKFEDALQRAKDAARGDQEALRAIDEDAIFDEVAGGTIRVVA